MLGPAEHYHIAWLPLRWERDLSHRSTITHKDSAVVIRVSVEGDHYPLLHVLPEPLLLASSAIRGYTSADHDRAASGGDGGYCMTEVLEADAGWPGAGRRSNGAGCACGFAALFLLLLHSECTRS